MPVYCPKTRKAEQDRSLKKGHVADYFRPAVAGGVQGGTATRAKGVDRRGSPGWPKDRASLGGEKHVRVVERVEYEMNYYRSQEGSLEMARLN